MRRTGMEREITDTELTAKGWGLCVSAAFFEEAAVLLGFGIQILEAPFLVLLFLWFLFTVLTGAALIAASNAAGSVGRMYRKYRSFAKRAPCAVYGGNFDTASEKTVEFSTAS